jgi:hypothetical protein
MTEIKVLKRPYDISFLSKDIIMSTHVDAVFLNVISHALTSLVIFKIVAIIVDKVFRIVYDLSIYTKLQNHTSNRSHVHNVFLHFNDHRKTYILL